MQIKNIFGGAECLDSFSKAYKTSQTKRFFPYERFDHPDKMQDTELPRMTLFTVNFPTVNLLKLNTQTWFTYWRANWLQNKQSSNRNYQSHPYWDWEIIIPATNLEARANEPIHRLFEWVQQQRCCTEFESNWKKYCLLPRQRYRYAIAWFHFSKPGQHLFTQICWWKNLSLHQNIWSFSEKTREDVSGGRSIVFTRKKIVDETFIRKSTNLCNFFVGIDASQLYPYSMCQPMLTGLFTPLDIDSKMGRFTLRQNETRSLKTQSCPIFKEQDQFLKLKASIQQAYKRKLAASVLMGFVLIATLCSRQWLAFTFSCLCQEVLLSLTERDNQRGSKKREFDG